MQTDYFLSDHDWLALSDFIADRPSICAALKIIDDPHLSAPGWDQMISVLGGRYGIYPERFREVFASENARMEFQELIAPLTIGAHPAETVPITQSQN